MSGSGPKLWLSAARLSFFHPRSFTHSSKEDTGELIEEGLLLGSGRHGRGDIPGVGLGKGRAKGPQSRNPALPVSTSNPYTIPGFSLQLPPASGNAEHQELTSRTLQGHSLEWSAGSRLLSPNSGRSELNASLSTRIKWGRSFSVPQSRTNSCSL